jgi:F-type H+-transporting ATPase subunit epsilon
MQVEIVSAEKAIYSGEASAIFAPAANGEVGIYPRHAEMIANLKPGHIRVVDASTNEETVIYTSGGVLEVQPHLVTVLSDTAERAADLDEQLVLEAKREAEELLQNQSADFDHAKARAELAELAAQLHSISKLRDKK